MTIKIMAPLQDMRSLPAIGALKNGDEVYFGVGKNNMRSSAKNFTVSQLPKLMSNLHKAGLKGNMTTNIIYYDNELAGLEKLMKSAKKAGVDSAIVHDMAGIEIAKKVGMNFHVSTQASISNVKAAKFYEKLGASRINLARELSLGQISKIAKAVKIPIEVFVHGAMCVSISGRCFFSLYNHGKSANRGECLHPCRREWVIKNEDNEIIYDGRFMSAKDLCMIDHMPELVKSGVLVLKIEGRMKDPRYIETVSRCYREALDACIDKTYTKQKVNIWKKELESVFNRGFSTGFFFGEPKNAIQKKNNSQATKKQKAIGKVTHYYKKIKVAELDVKEIKVGDEIMISGNTTYLKQKVDSLRDSNEKIVSKSKGVVSVKMSKRVRKNDIVYKII